MTGSESERRLAFADTLRMLRNRIEIFVSLPVAALDRLSLRAELDRIGRTGGAAARSAANTEAPARTTGPDRTPEAPHE